VGRKNTWQGFAKKLPGKEMPRKNSPTRNRQEKSHKYKAFALTGRTNPITFTQGVALG